MRRVEIGRVKRIVRIKMKNKDIEEKMWLDISI